MNVGKRERLLQDLIREGYLKTPRVIKAFRAIDRVDFVPEGECGEAYGNYPLPIGFGQTISQPLTVAFMLELLAPESGEKILDIGSGSGWQTALLAYIVSKPGRVVAIERIPELAEMTERNVRKYNFVAKGIVRVVCGDGSRGYPLEAPFDRIIAAAASGEIPSAWKEQLKIGGKIVAPVGHSVVMVEKLAKGRFKTEEHFGFSFVPLVEG